MPLITPTRRPLNPVVAQARQLRYGSFRPPTHGPFAPAQRPSRPPTGSAGTSRAPSQGPLPAPAPVPLSRLLPLDTLVQLRDNAARRVAARRRQHRA